jgi:hypothetical protein
MSLYDQINQRIIDLNETLADQEVTPQLRAVGRAGFDNILGESVLALAREVDSLKARVAELEAGA